MDRDLASQELWANSLARSRARREAVAAAKGGFELPARGLSVAALVAVTGGGVAAGKVLGDDDADARGSGSGARAAAVAEAPERPRPAERSITASTERDGAGARAATAPAATARGSGGPAIAPAADPVVALQRALGVVPDGDFGRATERALERWQDAHGLAADGVAGPATRRVLGLGPGPVLKGERPRARPTRRGGRGRPARAGGAIALQRALGVAPDGDFGRATERALERWQDAHGLAADGVAGPATRRALGLGPGPVLKRRAGRGGPGGRGGSDGRGDSGGGAGSSTVTRVVAAANAIASKPYVYGGGHGSFEDGGYDCSGSVSYALHSGGLLSTPLDSGGFMSYGAPGPGKRITIYANPGHVFMTIDGRRFDTSARWETGSRWTNTQRSPAGYTVRHPPGL